ncbi:type II toxin-antitoxin system VapC family toxin [Aureimonas sp. SA4125]|uniref:type II toxin-antitoxin system VapC family toxin n=1 Tax=Aureimonas sp. SA4125 TaxID=2826993 RepID=UPI001CC34A86|nr:type II toxin-antitoxin system VapC family toxin [Aureimonas sp. SA4125]
MSLLLDTHTLAWWLLDDPQLSQPARMAISRSRRTAVSPVTAFEMATKNRIGKWPGIESLLRSFQPTMLRLGLQILPLTVEHATLAGLIPGSHRDPFDRLLAAQAIAENLTLVTRDPAFVAFGVATLW